MTRLALARCALALAALPLVAGCELRADVELGIDRDGAGRLAVTLEADEALAEEAGAAGYDLVEQASEGLADLDGWTARASGDGVRVETTFADPAELREVSGTFADALAAPELRPLERFEVTLAEDRVVVGAEAGLAPTDEVAALGLDADEAARLLDDHVRYGIAVEMPGEVINHNADRQDGRRLVWEVQAGERVSIRAESERPRSPPLVPATAIDAVLVAVALMAVGLVAAWWRRRWRARG